MSRARNERTRRPRAWKPTCPSRTAMRPVLPLSGAIRPAARPGPLRSLAREGCLRRRLHRRHEEPQVARHRRAGPGDPRRTSTIAAPSAPTRRCGDGCGILVQIPHDFFAAECAKLGISLPEEGQYGVGHLFMPRDPEGFAARRGDRRQGDRRRRPAASRLARRAGRFERSRRERQGDRAAAPPDLRRQGQGHRTTRTTSSASCSSPAR